MAGPLKSGSPGKSGKITGKIAVVVSRWNEDITGALLQGATDTLKAAGIRKSNMLIREVPGSFELPLAAQQFAEKKNTAGVICIGCLIKGDTPHFDYISGAVAQGVMDVNLKTGKPVIFGVLTTNTRQQSIDRAGGKLGNKGEEAALTLLELLRH